MITVARPPRSRPLGQRIQTGFTQPFEALGVDETASWRGHHHITLFHDLKAARLLFATEGRDHTMVVRFVEDLQEHRGHAAHISAACTDLSKAYIMRVAIHLPHAELIFDKVHVIQLANQEPLLRHSRWCYLKDTNKLTARQLARLGCSAVPD